MTYKSAMAGLSFGGGKGVIIGDAKTDKTEALFEAYGDFVEQLGGRYITAEDVGIAPGDIEIVGRRTSHVAGVPKGGAGDGDPSPATAWGIFHGIRAAVRHQLKRDGLAGIEVAVQGLGHVGWRLAEYLHHAGAKLTVTDINAEVVARAQATFGARAVASDAIYGAEAEIFAPCALGGILNGETIPRLRASIVAGSANNQLAADTDGVLLHQRGILYAPDYVINAGGIINIAHEGADYDRKAAFDHCAGLYDTCLAIFARAETEGRSPHLIADEMAEERLAASRAQGSVGLRATG